MILLLEQLQQVSIVLTSIFFFISLFLTKYTFYLSIDSAFLIHPEYAKILTLLFFEGKIK